MTDPHSYFRCPSCKSDSLQLGPEKANCTQCGYTPQKINDIWSLMPDQNINESHKNQFIAMLSEKLHYQIELVLLGILAGRYIPSERRDCIAQLGIKSGDRILNHCAGLGGDVEHIIHNMHDSGLMVAMDRSAYMANNLEKMKKRYNCQFEAHRADARSLPYTSDFFDKVIHVGAFNQFSGFRSDAFDEIARVTKPGGSIIIVDEGFDPDNHRNKPIKDLFRKILPLFNSGPPTDLIPDNWEYETKWIMNGWAYLLKVEKPEQN
jgi:ubiquinone/menaquinone biosynthesis C-methylase UbiE